MNDLAIFSKKLDISLIESAMKDIEQVECEVQHDFCEGIYSRTLKIPKDTLILGKMHRRKTLNILLKGDISIYMGENEPVKRMKSPCIFISEPGSRKLGYAHEETLFTNIHPTDETDLEKIEEMFIIPEKEYLENKK